MIHHLKIDPIHFESIVDGKKTFEIRKDDRPYEVGHILTLNEYDRELQEYTGDYVLADIVGVFGRDESEQPYVIPGHVILSIANIERK